MRNHGGGHEGGTVLMMTGANSPGTRVNGGEADDAVAGGPSFDQILLKHAPGLATLGTGFANAIADARVESNEISTQCLSYSHTKQSVDIANPSGVGEENIPLMPALHPIDLYTEVFGSFVPGGGEPQEMVKQLRLQKSVLDGTVGQLARLHDLAPASEREKIEIHTEAVRKLERELSDSLAKSGCIPPSSPDPAIQGSFGSYPGLYANPIADFPDAPLVAEIGKLHLSVLRAAFQCDLLRVATFQWCPGQALLSFENLDPTDPETFYIHHGVSHREASSAYYTGPPPTNGSIYYEMMVRANTWYFERYAEVFAEWKTATDGRGRPLLDNTVIPLMTEVDNPAHSRNCLPALILGGRALGIQGGQFRDFQTAARSHNDLWMTVAQAFFPDSVDVLDEMPGEVFLREGVAPIDGIWARPA
jgi:hypothetical protein